MNIGFEVWGFGFRVYRVQGLIAMRVDLGGLVIGFRV